MNRLCHQQDGSSNSCDVHPLASISKKLPSPVLGILLLRSESKESFTDEQWLKVTGLVIISWMCFCLQVLVRNMILWLGQHSKLDQDRQVIRIKRIIFRVPLIFSLMCLFALWDAFCMLMYYVNEI